MKKTVLSFSCILLLGLHILQPTESFTKSGLRAESKPTALSLSYDSVPLVGGSEHNALHRRGHRLSIPLDFEEWRAKKDHKDGFTGPLGLL